MDPITESGLIETRRHFFGRMSTGIGAAALGSLVNPQLFADNADSATNPTGGLRGLPHFAAKAKRVIYLFMSGAPSQLDMWDYKPKMNDWFDKDLPDSVRNGQRITTMTSGQARFPIAPSIFKFNQHGPNGTYVSELLPYTSKMLDDLAVIKTVHTEAINHDPAITFIQTGSQLPGRPSTGAWMSYGLGSMNQNLPAFVVLHSTVNGGFGGQALYARLWGSGFLSTRHQGVSLRSTGDPVLYLSNPEGMSPSMRRRMLDELNHLNADRYNEVGDPEIQSRIAQYEMAYRMQTSVPELADTTDEPASTFDLYGEDARQPGTHAANCLLARRLAERGVRFIQVFHRGWDHHSNVQKYLPTLTKETDQGSAGLIQDLKQRGMLDETLVIWAGEFGRTVYSQGNPNTFGRDHHPRCFSIWMAGSGIKPGISYGQTDDYCYNIAENPVHVHDFHATLLHCLGINHEELTYRFQGRDFRLTDVHGKVVSDILT